ncbi:hypothetical protein LPJ53_001135 [Coemansia erecta]|uniref:Uncharacterized protein n=1 Tax=Coemansia erecta TaxID=147472 RepID=A0A9W8CT48_9FUNG|nr:hypothetical protein LPJ53_001135 [Coemansia erecta]
MTKRTVTSSNLLNDFRGAVLVLGSLQTSCEVALLDSQNGVVAASCFKFLSSGKVDNSQDFKIGINDPSSSTSLVYTLDRIDVHPKYDSSTYANNIAIIGFNTDSRQSWEAWAAGDRSEWNSVFFTSRAMISVSKKTWNPTRVVTLGLDSGCASASNLYKSNSDNMLCVSQAAVSLANSYCDLPYGTAWGIYQPNDLAVGAIYSHSVITSDSLCQATGTRYHIYTLIEPYLPWAGNVAGETFNLFTLDDYTSSASKSFSMTSVSGSSISGSKIVTGDYYPMQRVYEPVAVTTPSTSTGSGSTSSGSTGSTSSGSTNTGSTNTGSTNTGSTNTGSTNTGSTNTGSTNTGSTNTGSTNTGSTNTGSTNTGSTNTGSTNTGSTNTGSTNTGSTNTGSTNTGSTNSGSTDNSSSGTTDNSSGSGATSNNNSSSNNSSNGATDNNASGNSNSNGSGNSVSSSSSGSVKSSSSSDGDDDSLDTNGRNVTDKIDEDDVITINGSVVAIADLMTNSNEANLEVTHVYYLTQTDANGNIVVMSDIEVQTYAYSDYHDNTDDDDSQGGNPKDSSGLNASADNEKYNGLSRSAVIAIGVVVPVVTILILIGLFFLHKWWRRRRNAINWDPKSERDNINRIGIIDEMGMADGDRPSTESNSNTISPSNAHSRVVSAQLGQDSALADVDLNDAPAAGADGANAQDGANAEPLFKPGHETLPPVYNSHDFSNVKLPGEKVTYS